LAEPQCRCLCRISSLPFWPGHRAGCQIVTTTLGIDLSSQAAHTAACTLEWDAEGARVVGLAEGLDDAALVELAKHIDKVGIDVPLGWPRRFVDAVRAHASGQGWPQDYQHAVDRDRMRFRATDLAV